MRRSLIPFVVAMGWVLSLSACYSGPRSTASTVRTTLSTIAAPSTAVPTVEATFVTLPASSTSQPTVPIQTTLPAVTVQTDNGPTAAGHVVTKPDDDVHIGDSGPGVRQIQTALDALGYNVPVTGTFGPLTKQAVSRFQSKHGLKPDGIVGPATWSLLAGAPVTTPPKASTTTLPKSTTIPKTTVPKNTTVPRGTTPTAPH